MLTSDDKSKCFVCISGFQPKIPVPRFGEPLDSPEEDYDQTNSSFPLPSALGVPNFNEDSIRKIWDEQKPSLEDAMRADKLLRERQQG